MEITQHKDLSNSVGLNNIPDVYLDVTIASDLVVTIHFVPVIRKTL